jgi:hypothetical protein
LKTLVVSSSGHAAFYDFGAGNFADPLYLVQKHLQAKPATARIGKISMSCLHPKVVASLRAALNHAARPGQRARGPLSSRRTGLAAPEARCISATGPALAACPTPSSVPFPENLVVQEQSEENPKTGKTRTDRVFLSLTLKLLDRWHSTSFCRPPATCPKPARNQRRREPSNPRSPARRLTNRKGVRLMKP